MEQTVEQLLLTDEEIQGIWDTDEGWISWVQFGQAVAKVQLAKALDQTKDDCPNCRGKGQLYTCQLPEGEGVRCPRCYGTGKVGDWHPERLVVLDKDQSCPHIRSFIGFTPEQIYSEAQQDMLNDNWKKIKSTSGVKL